MLLQEQLQKLASHIEFCKIVSMGVHNRHLKPKVGGYFTATSPATSSGPFPIPLSLPAPSSGPSVPHIGSNVANYLRRGSRPEGSNLLVVHDPPVQQSVTTAAAAGSSAALVHFGDDSDFLIRRPSGGSSCAGGGILRNATINNNNSSAALAPSLVPSPAAANHNNSPFPSPPPPSPPLPSPPPPIGDSLHPEIEEEISQRCVPAVVDDAHIDDSPTAELLPSDKSKTWQLVINSEEVWLWLFVSLSQSFFKNESVVFLLFAQWN